MVGSPIWATGCQVFENPAVQGGGDAMYSCAHIAKLYALESAALVQVP